MIDKDNKLYHAVNQLFEDDCLRKMQDLPDESIDMVLCDLPYGITKNKWDDVIPLDELWRQYNRVIKPNGVIVLTAQGIFTGQLIMSQPKMFKYKFVWEKSKVVNFLNAKKQPLRKHEDVLVFYKKSPTYNPQMKQGKPYDRGIRRCKPTGSYGNFNPSHVFSETGERYPTDIIYFKTAECEGEVTHPTQKPVALGRYLIRTYTNEGDVVLDNAFGSGSFLVAAVEEGRNFIGIEKNKNVALFKTGHIDYIAVAKKRLLDSYESLPEEKRQHIIKAGLFAGK